VETTGEFNNDVLAFIEIVVIAIDKIRALNGKSNRTQPRHCLLKLLARAIQFTEKIIIVIIEIKLKVIP
jgi:hypothetical protein